MKYRLAKHKVAAFWKISIQNIYYQFRVKIFLAQENEKRKNHKRNQNDIMHFHMWATIAAHYQRGG